MHHVPALPPVFAAFPVISFDKISALPAPKTAIEYLERLLYSIG
jgi:hypothetical protein